MLIQKIKIRGSIGIQKGLGLDEIEIDFKNKEGLVALSGPNGRGKTTILELMSPYRTFASRKGALNHHFHLRDSFVETWFKFNGNQYHTIKKIDSGSDRAEAFIEINGESVVNGKVKEYDNYVLDLFGSKALFYNSVFCAQGSDSFADMTTGEIKNLFIEFLRLDRLAEYEKQSKEAIRFYNSKKDIINNEIDNIQKTIDGFSGLNFATVRLIDSNDRIDEDVKNNTLLIEEAEEKLEDLKKTKIMNGANIDKIVELGKQVKKLEGESAAIEKRHIEAEEAHVQRLLKITNERARFLTIISQKESIEEASKNLANAKEREKYFSCFFETILEDLAEIDRAMREINADKLKPLLEKKAALENDEELLELTWQSEDMALKFRYAKEKETGFLVDKRQAEKDIELAGYKKDVEVCKEKIAMSIDPACTSTICPALESIKDAKEQLPALESILLSYQVEIDKKIKELDVGVKESVVFVAEYKAALSKIDETKMKRSVIVKEYLAEITPEIERLEQSTKDLMSNYLKIDDKKVFNRESRDSYREKIKTNEELAAQLPDLKIAEARQIDLSEQEEKAIVSFNVVKAEFNEKFEEKDFEIKELKEKALSLDKQINVGVDSDILKTSTFLVDKNQETVELEKIRAKNNEELAVIRNSLSKKEEAVKELQVKTDIKSKLDKELSDWTYLKIACSKTGLQALEIDGAAPLITKEANGLLEMTFGLDFQIKIVTQDPESGKEVFWVMVIRGDGAEDKFENLSGGQKVWIAKALSLGMTLVSKQKSGKAFQTLFADEEDGALDREKALDFIGLYRSMMQSGSFDACMYISHNPDVVAMADNILDFSGDQLVWK